MESFSEIMSLYSDHSFNNNYNITEELKNMSLSRSNSNAGRWAVRKWLKTCKSTTKKVIRRTFRLRCQAAEASFIIDGTPLRIPVGDDPLQELKTEEITENQPSCTCSTPPSDELIEPPPATIPTRESNISFDAEACTRSIEVAHNGRELDPGKMFASLDVNLLALARENLKSDSVVAYRGLVQEKIKFFEERIAGLGNQQSATNEKLVLKQEKMDNLQEKVSFFEKLAKPNCLSTQEEIENVVVRSEVSSSVRSSEPSSRWDSREDEIHVIPEEDKIIPVRVTPCNTANLYGNSHIIPPVVHYKELPECDRPVLYLMDQVHKQSHCMQQATSIIQACQKVKAFEYGPVHLQAERLLLLAGLRRDMLLKKIRKMQFPEDQVCPTSDIIRAEISHLRFSLSKEHKNKKMSFIVVCSNESDMHVLEVKKAKSDKGCFDVAGVHIFEDLHEDCTMAINVYQINIGHSSVGQRMFQLKHDKNGKSRRRQSIQYKDGSSETIKQEKVLEPLYKIYNSLEINFADRKNVIANHSDGCAIQGVLTLQAFKETTTFVF